MGAEVGLEAVSEAIARLVGELSELDGVSGYEAPVRQRLIEQVRPHVDRMEVDALGNLIAVKGEGKPGPRVMIAAHMDEVGFMVVGAEREGLLRFRKVGGILDGILPGRAVRLGPDRVPGVVSSKAIHLKKPEDRQKVVDADQLLIDVGADSREEAERLVPPGTVGSFSTRFERLGEGGSRLKGKAFDDRIGCTLLALLLEQEFPFPIYGAFTVQEEIGLRGATVAAYRIHPDLAFVLEGTTCADIPGVEPHGRSTRLGAGPAITFMDAVTIPTPSVVRELIRVAEEQGIPWQRKETTAGGTDAGRIQAAHAGVPVATVSTPCRYIHSPAALMALEDAVNGWRLLKAMLEAVPEGRWRP